MFCPKCGLQNSDDTKFCRSCGVDLGKVLAVIEGRTPDRLPQSKQHNDLFSSGIRNLILGFGFLFVSILLLANIPGTFYWLLVMISAILLLASGITRLVKSYGMEPKKTADVTQPNSLPATKSSPALPPIRTEYIKPAKPTYEASDLAGQPVSVTEATTRQLQMDSDGESKILLKKQQP